MTLIIPNIGTNIRLNKVILNFLKIRTSFICFWNILSSSPIWASISMRTFKTQEGNAPQLLSQSPFLKFAKQNKGHKRFKEILEDKYCFNLQFLEELYFACWILRAYLVADLKMNYAGIEFCISNIKFDSWLGGNIFICKINIDLVYNLKIHITNT